MEIVSIKRKTFEMMVTAFGAPPEKVVALGHESDMERMERQLAGKEVCEQLGISPHILQTLRDRWLIDYLQVNHRFYYKSEETRRLIPFIDTLYSHGR